MTMARLPRPNSRTTAGRSGRHLRVWTALYEKRVKARLLSRRFSWVVFQASSACSHPCQQQEQQQHQQQHEPRIWFEALRVFPRAGGQHCLHGGLMVVVRPCPGAVLGG